MSQTARKLAKRIKRKQRDRRAKAKEATETGIVRSVLREAGVWDLLRSAHVDLPFLCQTWPRITVARGEGTPETPEAVRILQEAQVGIDGATIRLPTGHVISTQLFWRKCLPVLNGLYFGRPVEAEMKQLQEKLRPMVAPFVSDEFLLEFIRCALHPALEVEAEHSRVNDTLYYWRLLRECHGMRRQLTLLLHRESARKELVICEGKRRYGYWCGYQFTAGQEIEWIMWPGHLLGATNDDHVYPVLVQQHALERIYGKEGRLLFAKDAQGLERMLHLSLMDSLRKPTFHPYPKDPTCFLVEYRLYGERVGYLLAQRIGSHILIRTFLFLTMDGTPEGTKLWRELRLCRHAKQYLGLDSLAAFVMTDLQTDANLVALLEKCDCGHLFRVVGWDALLKEGYARAMNELLGFCSISTMQTMKG